MPKGVKQWYGKTYQGYMTPCKAKDRSRCWYHIPGQHYYLDQNQVDEYNESASRADAIGYRNGVLTHKIAEQPNRPVSTILNADDITAIPSPQVNFERLFLDEAEHMRDRFNDMLRCGEFPEGVWPVKCFNLQYQQNDDGGHKCVFVQPTYNGGELIIKGYDFITADEFDPRWDLQKNNMYRFLESQRQKTSADGDNTIGHILDTQTIGSRYYEIPETIRHDSFIPDDPSRGLTHRLTNEKGESILEYVWPLKEQPDTQTPEDPESV